VQLPLVHPDESAAPAPGAAQPSREATGSLRILIADDNVDAADTLAALLQVMGHEVQTVHDGEAAVAAAAQFTPQVVILDIGMPRMNGYEACRRIRAQPHEKRPMLVALTGWGQEQDLAQSQAAGFDWHLVKPIEAEALEKLLEAQVRGTLRSEVKKDSA
jgi:CheY-like chemotaxis protein